VKGDSDIDRKTLKGINGRKKGMFYLGIFV
jgi:hypothetical protein